MKTFNKILFFAVLLVCGLAFQKCKDNILTPVADTKGADSLVAAISALNTKLVTIGAKDKTLQIQLAKFQSKADSLHAISDNNNSYAQSVQYTVYIIDGSNSVTGVYYGDRKASCKDCKVSGVNGATVTVLSNGQTYTSTSADGRAIFNNLYVAGIATVTVSLKGYTGCTYSTYFNPASCNNCNIPTVSQTGATINASTNVMILPTTGTSATTYTGQLYINKSSMDDTLGRLYNKSTDVARYLTFISPNGPYHGSNNMYNYSGNTEFTQNQYGTIPSGSTIGFTNLTALTGINYIYGYPRNLSSYYNGYNVNYQYLPGDIISITYTGLVAFATIDAAGKYTLNVPSYQNDPGTIIGAAAGLGYGNTGGNLVHYQDNYTYLTTTSTIVGSTHPTLKSYNPTTYAVTPITTFYQVTKMFDFYPFIELDDDDGYGYIGGYSGYTQQFYSNPGQTVNRNIFFFAIYPTGQ
jgi:hypothetical protein